MMNSEVAKKLSTELLRQSGNYSMQIRHWHRRRTGTEEQAELKLKRNTQKSEVGREQKMEERCWEMLRKRLQGLDFSINMTDSMRSLCWLLTGRPMGPRSPLCPGSPRAPFKPAEPASP